MPAPCGASAWGRAGVIAQARCRQSLCRGWRQSARLFRHSVPNASRSRRRMQQLAPAAAAETAPKWGPQSEVDPLSLMPLEEAKPVTRRPGYRSFAMDTCEFLVAETPDGRLDLRDVYVIDQDSEDLTRPSVFGDLPGLPQHYQSVEIGAEYLGNVLEDKPAKQWVYKVYLIPIASQEPYELDLTQVFVMEDKARCLRKEAVVRLAPEDTAPHELRLRVRKGVLTIESAESLPSWEDVVRANQEGLSALSLAERALLDRAVEGGLSWEEVQAVVGEEYVRLWQVEGESEARAGGAEAHGGGEGAVLPGPDHFTAMPDKLEDEIDDNLKDFLAEYDDENDSDYEDFDSPAVDY